MSRIVLGGSKFHNLTQRQVNTLLDYAFALGVNEIDTSPYYGNSQQLIGTYRRSNPDFLVSTKVGLPRKNNNHLGGEEVIEQFNEAMNILNLDSLETLFLHSVPAKLVNDEIFEVLKNIRLSGRATKIGYSGDNQNLSLMAKFKDFDSYMVTFNLIDVTEHETIKILKDRSLYIKRPIARGVFQVNLDDLVKNYLKKIFKRPTSYYAGSYEQRYRYLFGEPKFKKHDIKKFIQFLLFYTPNSKYVIGVSTPKHLKQIFDYFNKIDEEILPDFTEHLALVLEMSKKFNWKALS
jgi:aryl-alcohol dehydrogenase-like predicted oxidoreductase